MLQTISLLEKDKKMNENSKIKVQKKSRSATLAWTFCIFSYQNSGIEIPSVIKSDQMLFHKFSIEYRIGKKTFACVI